MDDNETLFSLELAVNSLRIDPHTVICRMPAVAFRLLDFPSIMVEQLDETEAEQLKRAIQHSWEYEENIPPQLEELKDRYGNHEFKKGKSSLYKYKLNSLVSHLDNTPLYIMIVDVWTPVPKLIAHCNVSLKEVMHRIRKDVSEFGVSVPSVHGIQGKFPVFNLMGTEIGWISLGVRLLSLGGNLIHHIADASLAKNKESALTNDVENVMADQQENLQMPSVTVGPVVVPQNTGHRCDHERIEDNSPAIGVNFACQTTEDFPVSTKSKQRPLKSLRIAADHILRENEAIMCPAYEDNDWFITNTHIPPPLIYNSENDVKVKESRRHRVPEHVFQHRSFPSPLKTNSYVPAPDNSVFSSPDVDGRKDLEVQYVIHPPEYNSSPNVRKILRSRKKDKSTVDANPSMQSEHRSKEEQKGSDNDKKGMKSTSDMVEHLHKLPILQALLRELSILNRRDFDTAGQILHSRDNTDFQITSAKHSVEHGNSGKQSKSHVAQEGLKVSKSKPPVQKGYRHKHKECAKPPVGVPASKGWLRQQPQYGKQQKETKLTFKMTNSQKLRIQKHNPEAFRQLEEEERIAEIKFQMRTAAQMREKETKQRPLAPHPSENMLPSPDANISTEIARHFEQEQPDVEYADDIFKRGMETFKIPTVEINDEDTDNLISKEDVTAYCSVDEKDASGSEKSVRSISVHLPTASVQEDDESSSDESQEGPKHLFVPGFPEGPQEDERPLEHVTPTQAYSDDFEDSYRYVSTGEQELANIQSSIASGTSSNARQDHSVEHTDYDHSDDSSYKTAESVQSARSVKDQPPKVEKPPSKSSSSSTSSKYPPSVLSIPQPQMSANSPVPLARRSMAKSAIFNQPPQPKPRLSLDHTSSISNMSVLAPELSNTLDSSEVNTLELKPDLSADYGQDDAYSDDFESDN
ncbi:microtubule-associated protein 10 [Strongylocentrotus purpuratus]|uniref:Microtubule-associated protein 10 C-terminal domain-containing protein n=1 Tax=Strongylocentrotus purpuratus TaxID=7668 RepID=A0A7M7GJL8_STRPU|nr:microtubule-associated protein 10 [Strongylocentrotus purpuratus]